MPVHNVRNDWQGYAADAHTVILVLVYPTIPFLSLDHQFIIPKPSIDESIDESPCKICTCRVHIRGRTGSY
jgi:hypothetical protein